MSAKSSMNPATTLTSEVGRYHFLRRKEKVQEILVSEFDFWCVWVRIQ